MDARRHINIHRGELPLERPGLTAGPFPFPIIIIDYVTHRCWIESEYQFHRVAENGQVTEMEARLGLILAFSLVLIILAYAIVFPLIDAGVQALMMGPRI